MQRFMQKPCKVHPLTIFARNHGYFAFDWGDALFVVLVVVNNKESKPVKSPARFHIGDRQLHWLESVLSNSSQKWKFLFGHHPFGGADTYGRGGAAYAEEHEQAQIQALAEQYGAHFFYGHDHLPTKGWANGVLYYCCGLAWGLQFDYYVDGTGHSFEDFYPEICVHVMRIGSPGLRE